MSRKNKKSYLTIALSVVMAFVICLVTMGSVPATIYTAYIDPALKEILETASSTDLIPVDVWLYEIDTEDIETEALQTAAMGEGNVSTYSLNAEPLTVENLESEQIDTYIETERALYAEAQAEQSEAFLDKYSNMFASTYSLNDNGGSKVTFVSQYAPSIQMELTPAQINNLSKDLSVESIYYAPNLETANCSDVANLITSAAYARDTLSLDGTGIKIGMIEARGLPDKNLSCFTSSNIIYDPNVGAGDSAHANLVAAVMISKAVTIDGITYKGIVPNATLYATWSDTMLGTRYRAEWLLTQGVNVINMSLGSVDTDGSYTSDDRWYDHIALQHSVHLVVAAGNEGDDSKYITAPGMSYNAITVGNLDDCATAKFDDDEISYSSSYLENYTTGETPEKPDLVAPGEFITTAAGTESGTSFAAPQVAGIVAQMCQAKPALKTLQDVMKSILVATTSHTYHTYTPNEAGYEKYGAGLVNAQNAYNTASKTKYFTSSFAARTANGSVKTHTFTLSSTNSIIRVSLSWLNYMSLPSPHEEVGTISGCSIADLTLTVKNSSGTVLGTSSTHGNVEIVELTNLPAGTYTIEVTQIENSAKTVYYGVAWW